MEAHFEETVLKVVTIIGTRPEIIKMSPLLDLLNKNFDHYLIHSGQHYDPELDEKLFKELKLKSPNKRLKTGSGTFPVQMYKQMDGIFKELERIKPDAVIVQGDTNTALSGALVARRLGIKVIHVESGCRSGNLEAPEEQNRILIDAIGDVLLCSDNKSFLNLKKEKKDKNGFVVGSTTFDAIKRSKTLCNNKILKELNLTRDKYAVATLHRAEGMREIKDFLKKIDFLNWVAEQIPIVFCVHPRTQAYIKKHKIKLSDNIIQTKPLTHLNFISLIDNSKLVLSDSGGIQEEAAAFNRPCLVLRKETEWTRLIKAGKNFLFKTMGQRDKAIVSKLLNDKSFYRQVQKNKCPESKTGAAQKIISIIRRL